MNPFEENEDEIDEKKQVSFKPNNVEITARSEVILIFLFFLLVLVIYL